MEELLCNLTDKYMKVILQLLYKLNLAHKVMASKDLRVEAVWQLKQIVQKNIYIN